MGSVYLAEHLTLERRCAIKLLRRHLAASLNHVNRFIREAKAASLSAHPNVIEVLDAGYTADGTAYYAMELLEGEDLAATLCAENRLPWPRVRHIALQICEALAASHARDVVHRDLKPANCFRISRGGDPDFIKVLDFGVAKLINSAHETLTGPGDLVGTPCYMAPEQVTGKEIDHRTDIYALGAMLYRMLTGRPAFVGNNPFEIMVALTTRFPDPFSVVAPDLDLPPEVFGLVMKAMAHDPAQRFASMQDFAAAIAGIDAKPHATTTEPSTQPSEPIITSAPPSTPPETQARVRRPAIVATSIAVLVLFVVVVVVFRREPTPQPPPEVPRIILPTPSDPTLPISCRQDLPDSCDAGMHCRGGACVPAPSMTAKNIDPCATDFFCDEGKTHHDISSPYHCIEEGLETVREVVRYQAACREAAGISPSNCPTSEASEHLLTQDGLDALLNGFPSLVFMLPSDQPSVSLQKIAPAAEPWPDSRTTQYYMREIKKHAAVFRNAGLLLFISQEGQDRTNSRFAHHQARVRLVQELVLSSFADGLTKPDDRVRLSERFIPLARSRESWRRLDSYLTSHKGPTVWWSDDASESFLNDPFVSKRARKSGKEAVNNSLVIVKIPSECVMWWR